MSPVLSLLVRNLESQTTLSVHPSDLLNGIAGFFASAWSGFAAFLARTDVYPIVIVWVVVFTVMTFLMLSLGFGPGGVVAGSLAAGFQAWAYGAFTPAGGIFATMTSLGMLGVMAPPVVAVAAGIATVAAGVVWVCGWFS